MRQVPSPACPAAPGRRALRALVSGALACAVIWGSAPAVSADPLVDRHEQLAQNLKEAREQIDEHTAALTQATSALEASRSELDAARAALASTREQLAQATTRDAELAESLAQEQQRLREATAAADEARAQVEAQRELIAQAARDAYQSQSDLTGIAVVLGGQSTTEIGQRLQWDTTIFGTTAQRLDELSDLEEKLAAAEAAQAAIEAQVAADKRDSEANVARIAELEADAVEQEGVVAELVASNEKAAAEAQAALDADAAEYQSLLAEEVKVQGELAGRVAGQLSSGLAREDIERLIALGVVSTNSSTYPLVDTGPQLVLSAQGFIRPVKAKPGSPFGKRFHPILKYWRNHNGTDWGASCGTPLYAAQSGTVVKAGVQGGFGNYVIIDHGVIDGKSIMTGYAHQSKIAVTAGQSVAMGQLIGYVGTTGLSTGCHLHLQVYENGTPVDPMGYIP